MMIWFLVHVVYITFDGLSTNDGHADLAVILGTTVNEDGTLSERLENRLKCGLDLYLNSQVQKILVSGGLGKEGHYEGDKMKEYLLKNGVPDSVVVVDNLGNNTIASVDNTLKLKDSLKFESIIVVSQYFHLSRSKMLFRKWNFEKVTCASPRYFEFRDLYSLFREFVAFYVQLVRA